jgi:putative transposase
MRPVVPEAKQRPPSVRRLTDEEKTEALEVLTCEAYVDRSPASIVASLLDLGRYICSVRTLYRFLALFVIVMERRRIARHPAYSKPELLAMAPRQVWTWDITKLKGPSKGIVYNLYVVLDMYSRYVVGWLLAHREQDVLAADLIEGACVREGISAQQLTIHADNGSSMRSSTVSSFYDRLGISQSHSRPYCSNDNPYSESQFKTMKYSPEFPERFDSIEEAREFCTAFFDDYNNSMYHSALAMLTPAMVHHGKANDVIEQRQAVLTQAYSAHPERFVKGMPTHKPVPDAVYINKPIDDSNRVVIS